MLGFDVLGKQVDLAPAQRREGIIEHPANVIFGIVDDPPGFLVPQHRHRDATVKTRIGGHISLAQEREAIDGSGL